jgi:hypothetical protein
MKKLNNMKYNICVWSCSFRSSVIVREIQLLFVIYQYGLAKDSGMFCYLVKCQTDSVCFYSPFAKKCIGKNDKVIVFFCGEMRRLLLLFLRRLINIYGILIYSLGSMDIFLIANHLGRLINSKSDDDLSDRLNYRYTPALLVLFSVVIITRQFGSGVGSCLIFIKQITLF